MERASGEGDSSSTIIYPNLFIYLSVYLHRWFLYYCQAIALSNHSLCSQNYADEKKLHTKTTSSKYGCGKVEKKINKYYHRLISTQTAHDV